MEKEVSAVINVSVMLITLAVLISIVIVTVSVGNSIKVQTGEIADRLEIDLRNGELNSLIVGDVILVPKASVYNILSSGDNGVISMTIDGVKYGVNNNGHWAKYKDATTVATDEEANASYGGWFGSAASTLKSTGLTGKVYLTVTSDDAGTYELTIISE